MHCEFFRNGMHMALDCTCRGVKLLGDFLVAWSVCNRCNNLKFPFRHFDRFARFPFSQQVGSEYRQTLDLLVQANMAGDRDEGTSPLEGKSE